VAKPLPGGWNLRTGVFPMQEATADIAKGVLTISGGGGRGTWRRGTVVEADRARMTAAFVYKAFKGRLGLNSRARPYRPIRMGCVIILSVCGIFFKFVRLCLVSIDQIRDVLARLPKLAAPKDCPDPSAGSRKGMMAFDSPFIPED